MAFVVVLCYSCKKTDNKTWKRRVGRDSDFDVRHASVVICDKLTTYVGGLHQTHCFYCEFTSSLMFIQFYLRQTLQTFCSLREQIYCLCWEFTSILLVQIFMCNVKMFLHVVVHVQTGFFVVHNEVTDIYRMTHHDFLIIGFQQLLLFVMFVLALCHNCSWYQRTSWTWYVYYQTK